jgi:hypothetical protein
MFLSVVPVETVMTKVDKLGKGAILMHDSRTTRQKPLLTMLNRLTATRSCR